MKIFPLSFPFLSIMHFPNCLILNSRFSSTFNDSREAQIVHCHIKKNPQIPEHTRRALSTRWTNSDNFSCFFFSSVILICLIFLIIIKNILLIHGYLNPLKNDYLTYSIPTIHISFFLIQIFPFFQKSKRKTFFFLKHCACHRNATWENYIKLTIIREGKKKT